MADEDKKPIVWFLENMGRRDLSGWIFAQMSVGAGYAAIALVIPILFIVALIGLAQLLPDPEAALTVARYAVV